MIRPAWARLPASWRSFVIDTITLQSGQLALSAVQAIRALLVLRWLGAAAFGPLALAQAVLGLVAIADGSTLGRAALVEVTRAMAGPSREGVSRALARFLALHVLVNAFIVAVVWLAAPAVAGWAYGRQDVGEYVRWLALPLVIESPYLVVSLVLQASRRMGLLVGLETARAAGWLVITVAALAVEGSVRAVVAAHVVTAVLTLAAVLAGSPRLRRVEPGLPRWRDLAARAPREPLGEAARSGALITADKSLGSLSSQLPLLLLGLWDTTAVAYLAAALRVMILPVPLLAGLARNLDVVLALRAADGAAAVRQAWRRATWRAALLWLPVACATALVGVFAIEPVLGRDYAPAIAALGPLLAQSILLGAGVGLGPAARALDLVGYTLTAGIVALAVTLGPGVWLIQSLGLVGAAAFHALRTGVGLALSAAVVWHAERLTATGASSPGGRR